MLTKKICLFLHKEGHFKTLVLGLTLAIFVAWACLGAYLSSTSPAHAQSKRGRLLHIGLIMNLTPTQGADPASVEEFRKSLLRIFKNSYGKKLVEIKPKRKSKASFDFLLFTGAANGLDHLVEINGTGNITKTGKEKKKGKIPYQFQGSIRLIDVSQMTLAAKKDISFKGMGDLDNVPSSPTKGWDLVTRHLIKEMLAFYNPNLMKKMSLQKVGDYFYEKERCSHALPLYEKIDAQSVSFAEGDVIQKRMAECEKLNELQGFSTAKYSFDLKFQNLGEQYQQYFKAALKKRNFKELMKKYSSKPVTFHVIYDEEESGGVPGEIILRLYYDSKRFKIPRRFPDGRIALNFEPLNDPIIELLNFHTLTINAAPKAKKEFFKKFITRIKLQKANGDYATFHVGIDKKKNILAPLKMWVKSTGYEKAEIDQSDANYTRKNIFVLGEAVRPDGTKTVNVVVYEFFNIKT